MVSFLLSLCNYIFLSSIVYLSYLIDVFF